MNLRDLFTTRYALIPEFSFLLGQRFKLFQRMNYSALICLREISGGTCHRGRHFAKGTSGQGFGDAIYFSELLEYVEIIKHS